MGWQFDSQRVFRALQAVALSGLLSSVVGSPLLAQSERPLWQQKQATKSVRKYREAMKTIAVQVDVDSLRSESNAGFSLPLPSGNLVNITKSRERRTEKGLVWHGQIAGDPESMVSFSVVNDTVVGSILTGSGQAFRLRRDPNGEQVIEEIDLGKLPSEDDATPKPAQRGDNARYRRKVAVCSTDPADRIDVLVVYTADARIGAGGTDAMVALLNNAEDQTNLAYENSGIQQRIKIVHKAEVDYQETGNVTTDRGRLQAKGDGYLDAVHKMRDRYGADIVALIVENIGPCGKSFIMTNPEASFEDHAFSVVRRRCAAEHGKYSFAHELGHVMGARHDRFTDPKDGSPYAFNHGYIRVEPTSGRPWRTIMAYSTNKTPSHAETNPCGLAAAAAGVSPDKYCPRVLNFSNPLVSVRGDPTGSDTEDNHQALNKTAPIVAKFRCARIVTSNR